MIRVALGHLREADEPSLRLAAQLGCSGVVVNSPALEGAGWWEPFPLLALRRTIEAYGLRLESLENVPIGFYQHAMLGVDGAAEQARAYARTLESVARAGIPILGLHWMPAGVWRTAYGVDARGGARAMAFDAAQADDVETFGRRFEDAERWRAFEAFMGEVLPVAERVGVRIALHPDDPPLPMLGGVAHVLRDRAAFDRVLDTFDSPALGLNFCVGTWSEMGGVDVLAALCDYLARDRVAYVHLRDVRGAHGRFEETWLGEGDVDAIAVLGALLDAGFDGFVIDDHTPALDGDHIHFPRVGHAHATGWLQGALRALAATRAGAGG